MDSGHCVITRGHCTSKFLYSINTQLGTDLDGASLENLFDQDNICEALSMNKQYYFVI